MKIELDWSVAADVAGLLLLLKLSSIQTIRRGWPAKANLLIGHHEQPSPPYDFIVSLL